MYLIELKKDGGANGVRQLADYMDLWADSAKCAVEGRAVHGVLITGSADERTRKALVQYAGYNISWQQYDYRFSVDRVE